MKGRPILGIISGFMFGLFLGPTLFMWGVIPLHSELMWILPLLGIVLGLVMAWWAPFGRKTSTASAEAMSGQSTPADNDQADNA
jgi:uncharacterized YccA/Bax inhibitor family protein